MNVPTVNVMKLRQVFQYLFKVRERPEITWRKNDDLFFRSFLSSCHVLHPRFQMLQKCSRKTLTLNHDIIYGYPLTKYYAIPNGFPVFILCTYVGANIYTLIYLVSTVVLLEKIWKGKHSFTDATRVRFFAMFAQVVVDPEEGVAENARAKLANALWICSLQKFKKKLYALTTLILI